MILMATNNFSAPTPTLTAENYHIWAIKIKAYLKGLKMWKEFWRGFTVKSVSNIQSFGKSRRTMMREANERVVDDLNASSAKDLGIYKKIVEQKWNKQMW